MDFCTDDNLHFETSREQNNVFGVILLDVQSLTIEFNNVFFCISRVFENNAVLQQSEGRC